MRFRRFGAVAAATIAGVAGVAACGSSSTSTSSSGGAGGKSESIVIGSQAFPENEVLAYVYADALKAAGYTGVSVKPGLGSREVTAPALASGQIDMIAEYLGNYLTYVDPSSGVLTVAQTTRRSSPSPPRRASSSATTPRPPTPTPSR